MFSNFLKSSIHYLKRNKIFTLLNSLGLSLAMAVSFIIIIYVVNELSVNHYHKKWPRIYRVNTYHTDIKRVFNTSPYVLATTIKSEYSQIERSANSIRVGNMVLRVNNEEVKLPGAVGTSSEIFDIFTIPLIGNSKKRNQLDDLNSIVLSRKLAERIFPGFDPVGNEIKGSIEGRDISFIVTGVFEDNPLNSAFRAQCLVNDKLALERINSKYGINDAESNWKYDYWTNWILLKKNSDINSLNKELRAFEKRFDNTDIKKNFRLQKLSDIYMNTDNVEGGGNHGSTSSIRIFSAIAFLILLVAAINYILLSAAVSTGRTKEIGIRKASGAENRSIRRQMLSESVFMAVIILPAALLIMWVFLPFTSHLFQKEIRFLSYNILIYVVVCLILTLLIGFISGIYTSYYLSRLKVLDILQNTINSGYKKHVLRSILIVVQLIIFCTLATCAFITGAQYKYAVNRDPGFNTEDIILMDLGYDFQGYSSLINYIRTNPYVISAAGSVFEIPTESTASAVYPHFVDKDKEIVVETMSIDYDFMKTVGLQMLHGRDFSESFVSDSENSVILNEEAVKQLGIKDPVGKMLGSKVIIGIVRNFNLHSIRTDIPPLKISLNNKHIFEIVIHYKHGYLNKLLPFLKSEWERVAPGKLFDIRTMRDSIEDVYSSEKSLTITVTVFAVMVLIISVMGLLGLTLYTVRSRTKEIGIRKIFGSSEQSVVFLLLRDNLILVVIAAVISIPLTVIITTKWLSNFSERTGIHWWFFFISSGISFIVVFLTVLIYSYKASVIDPVEALRYE